ASTCWSPPTCSSTSSTPGARCAHTPRCLSRAGPLSSRCRTSTTGACTRRSRAAPGRAGRRASSTPGTCAGSRCATPVRCSSGRAFVRVLGADAPRVGLGHDMRLPARELADRYRDGMVAEGAHVLDAGMVGTEMLYWLVGAHELDGGLMCTASHNPAAYTGAKL